MKDYNSWVLVCEDRCWGKQRCIFFYDKQKHESELKHDDEPHLITKRMSDSLQVTKP